MKYIIPVMLLTLALAGCTTGDISAGRNLEPIPGSITYGGQPATRLTKAPVGSSVPHEFRDQLGRRVSETYIIQPDRSLKLVSRQVCLSPICDD